MLLIRKFSINQSRPIWGVVKLWLLTFMSKQKVKDLNKSNYVKTFKPEILLINMYTKYY